MGMDNDFATGYALGQDSNCRNDGWDGFGGGGIWALLIFSMIFRGGFGGWGGFGGGWGTSDPGFQGALTRADLCSEFNFNNLDNAVRGIQQGLCDGFYSQNTTLMNGFHGVDNAVCQLGYQTQQGFNGVSAQLSNMAAQNQACCCETQRLMERGFCDTNYNIATNTTSIIQNAHSDTDRILGKLCDMEMAHEREKNDALRMENQSLKFQLSQNAQNAYLTANNAAQTAELIRRCCPEPVPAYQVPAPYPYGCERGCNSCGC